MSSVPMSQNPDYDVCHDEDQQGDAEQTKWILDECGHPKHYVFAAKEDFAERLGSEPVLYEWHQTALIKYPKDVRRDRFEACSL